MNDNNEKIYRIELTNEEYKFLENLKNELKHKLSKMNKEELIEYFKSLCPEEKLSGFLSSSASHPFFQSSSVPAITLAITILSG